MQMEYKPRRTLRSVDSGQVVEPRVQTKHGEAAISCYAAHKWSKLPIDATSGPCVNVFTFRL